MSGPRSSLVCNAAGSASGSGRSCRGSPGSREVRGDDKAGVVFVRIEKANLEAVGKHHSPNRGAVNQRVETGFITRQFH
jgi:hypothetical protein